jgi:cell wall-associated NlpC family hydrolase
VVKLIRYFSAGIIIMMLLSGCASDPVIEPPVNHPQSSSSPVVNYALTLQGAPYRYGSDNPQDGFDCSGFIHHVYLQNGIDLPRTAEDMAASLPTVENDALQPGDLVFFNTNGKLYSHVGLYINNDNFIHAPSARTGKVMVSTLKNDYWRQHYVGARRP